MAKHAPLNERFHRFVPRDVPHGMCWNWSGYKNPEGYGHIMATGKRVLKAHRVSYAIYNGEIPIGMVVRHKCDNPACVNPQHLELGTHADNARDKAVRKRTRTKIDDSTVLEIRSAKGNCLEIGDKFGVSAALVSLVKNGKRRIYINGDTA